MVQYGLSVSHNSSQIQLRLLQIRPVPHFMGASENDPLRHSKTKASLLVNGTGFNAVKLRGSGGRRRRKQPPLRPSVFLLSPPSLYSWRPRGLCGRSKNPSLLHSNLSFSSRFDRRFDTPQIYRPIQDRMGILHDMLMQNVSWWHGVIWGSGFALDLLLLKYALSSYFRI
jgi:hypothetical protein